MPEHVTDQINRTRSNIGIRKIDRIYDKNKDQLILMVSTVEMLEREVNAFLKGNELILEASIQLNYNKPYRMHLAGEDIQHDSAFDISLIGFSEIKLKPGYHYTVISCQLINPTLVKIILGSQVSFAQYNHFRTIKNKNR